MGEANVWQPRTILQLSGDTKSIEERLTATAGQTLFTLVTFAYSLNTGALEVHKNGLLLTKGVDWSEGTDTTFSLVLPATAGDQVVATGKIGITADVDVRDTDIYVTNYQAIRDYTGTEITLYAQGKSTVGDTGEGFFQEITGAMVGTFVDNDETIIVPTGGDGSIGWLNVADKLKTTLNVASMKALTGLVVGFTVVQTAEFAAAGEGGGAGNNNSAGVYDIISGTGTANARDIIAHNTLSLSFVLRIGDVLNIMQLGAVRDGTDQTALVQSAADLMQGGEGLGGAPTFGGTDGGYIDIPQGIQWTPVGFLFRPNVTIRQDTGTGVSTYINGENVSGAVNEFVVIAGFPVAILVDVHTDYTIDTPGGVQVVGRRAAFGIRVNGVGQWQIANNIDNTTFAEDDHLTFFANTSSKQILLLSDTGNIRYGKLDGIQDFSQPSSKHVINQSLVHQEESGNLLAHVMRIIASGVKDSNDIVGATQANPCVISTRLPHGSATGALVRIISVVGMTELNNLNYTITVIDDNSFSLDGINSTGFTAYSSGGDVLPQVIHQKNIQLQTTGELTMLADDNTTFILRIKDSGFIRAHSGISPGAGFTTAELADVSDAINTVDKEEFKIVGNSTTGRMVYASGAADSDDWLFMDGTVAHSPI